MKKNMYSAQSTYFNRVLYFGKELQFLKISTKNN